MADFGLHDIIREATELSDRGANFTQEIVRLNQERSAAARENAGLVTEAGQLEADVQETRDLAVLRAQKLAKQNARALGTDASASSSVIADVNSRIRNDLLTYNQASQQLEQMDANDNILANPLGWFNSLMNRQEISAVANQSLNRLETNTSMLARMHNLTQSDVQTQLMLAETADADTIAKKSRQIAIKSQIDANKARADAATYDIEGYQTLQQYGNSEFNRRITLYNAQVDAYRFEQSRKMQERNLQLQQQRLEREIGKDQADQFLAERVNQAARAVGLRELPLDVIISQRGKNTPTGQQVSFLESIGVASYQKGSLAVGNSPYETKYILKTIGGELPASVSADVKNAFDYADTKFAEVKEAAEAIYEGSAGNENSMGLNSKTIRDPNAVAEVYNKLYQEHLDKMDSNLSSALSVKVGVLESRFPEIKDTELYKTVLEPMSVGTNAPITFEGLGQVTAEHIARGEISSEAASQELAEISSLVFNDYRASSGRLLVGAKLPEPNEFKINLTVAESRVRRRPPLGLASLVAPKEEVIINPTNSTDWNSFFQRKLVAKRSEEIEASLRDSFNNTGAEQ